MNSDLKTTEELSSLPSQELLHKLDELRHAANLLGYEMAEAEKEYNDLKELMPSFLAEIQNSHFGNGIMMNMQTAKVKALADPVYQDKLKLMNEAEYKARLKKVEYQGLMKSIEALTAISFVRNSELKLSR